MSEPLTEEYGDAVTVEQLRRRARQGDARALQALRDRGFFAKMDAAKGFPLSHAQQRLWLVHQMSPDPAVYNVPHAFAVDGALDADALRRALEAVGMRHESLRTSFATVGIEPRQFVHDRPRFRLEVTDLRGSTDAERQARAAMARDRRTGFDLTTGPLLRATLFRIADERHLFFINLHHIVCDGWSLQLLARDLGALYAGARLEPLARQYKDYAAAEAARVEALGASRAYWHRQLADTPPPAALADRLRPSVQTAAGATCRFEIDEPAIAALERVGREHAATPFMTSLALLKLLLYRQSGQADQVVGTPVVGRDQAELEGLVGVFVNTLALRDRLDGRGSFRTLLQQVRQTALDAYAHQAYPFDRLVGELPLERDVSQSPLFSTLLSFEHADAAPLALGGASVTPIDIEDGLAKFDLTCFFTRSARGLAVAITYNSDLFRRERIEAMGGHLRQLAIAAAGSPDVPIGRLPMLAPGELAAMLTFSPAPTEYGRGRAIDELFEEQARATPDRLAVVCGDVCLTYAELDAAAVALAARLRTEFALEPEECVGVMLSRSEGVPVAWLAILKAGGAYVPLAPGDPPRRLQHILTETRVRVVISEAMHIGLCASIPRLLTIDIRDVSTSSIPSATSASSASSTRGTLAYVIYTSGSTGAPKGVMVEHDAVARLVRSTDYVRLDHTDRILQTGSLAFDASTFEIWGALLNGGAVCFAPEMALLDAGQLRALMARHGVTTMWLTSSLFNEVADQDPGLFRGLRQLLIGGERLSPRHVTRVRDACPALRLVNGYGPTENTTFTACFQIDERFDADVPIGRPIANTSILILDARGEVVPVGVAGEICAGGDGLARGYVGDPALTAHRFVPHPFGNGERLYRTGDIGRWRPDGVVEYLGRADAQVKIRGQRIEPGEIEHALLRHRSVRQCAVVVRESEGERQLVAYVVPADAGLDVAELRDFLRASIPEYMVPSHLVALEALPLGRTGKVDRGRLPAPGKRSSGSDADTRPWTETEHALGDIWKDLLDLADLSLHANFFELGGHSLRAVQLVARIHAALQARINLIDVFTAPTIARLAPIVDAARPMGAAAIPVVPAAADYAASHAQRRLWVLERMGAITAAYNIAGAFEIRGAVNVPALSRAINSLAARHDSLRTTFSEADGEPRQVIHPFDSRRDWLRIEDGREGTTPAATRFDLEKGPLFAATLARFDDRFVLHLEMHHVISDGWSIDVLLRELLALYAAHGDGAASPLAPLRVQYRDYAAWQNEYLRSPAAAAHRDHWHRALEGPLPLLDLPADRARPAVQTFRGDVVQVRWPAETFAALAAVGRRHGASAFMTFLGLVKVLLYRCTRQGDLVVGSPVALRDHPDLEHQVGFFVNMLPLRDRLSGRDSFAGVLDKVRGTVTAALEHRVYPFDRLVEELEITRDMGRNPVFDCVVTYQNASKPNAAPRDLEVSAVAVEERVSKFDLTFAVTEELEGGAAVAIEYSTDLFDRERIERMAAQLTTLAESASRESERAIGVAPIMPPDERRRIVSSLGADRRDYPGDSTIAATFERQVVEGPDRVAVCFEEKRLTYRQLDDLANGVAAFLSGTPRIQTEACVGVLLDRSDLLPVAWLGILKAGGAYLPLDAAYPAARMEQLLRQAGCRVVLSERKHLEGVLAHVGGVVAIDVQSLPGGGPAPCAPAGGADARSLAYVMYTSGSTGVPKGALIEQRSVVRLVKNTNYVELGPATRVLQTGSPAFDASTFEIWGPLLNGGAVIFAPQTELLDAGTLRALIARHGVTMMWMTAGLFNQLVDEDARIFGALRHLLIGGEKLSPRHVTAVRDACPDLRVTNGYGPTENTTFTACFAIEREYLRDIPIGRPIANTEILLLDEDGELVPIGVPGELCAGGDGLARGYLGDPAATAAAFVPHPFDSGARIYRTGDVARWRRDGTLEYLGRRDGQVKVRGYRIELAEIESALMTHDAVGGAVVAALAAPGGGKTLVAYVTSTRPAAAPELRAHLAAVLPSYMVPAEFVQLERFPLTRNGKVDRSALPAPDAGSRIRAAADGPTTAAEAALVQVWEETLGRAGVGIADNYFELGGDSIRAIQIASRLRRRGWTLSIQDLFYSPTIAQLAPRLSRADAAGAPEEVSGDVPLTAVQRWFFNEQPDDRHHFNQAVLLRSRDRVDPEALRAAVSALQAHHDILRATYRVTSDGVTQTIAGVADAPAADLSIVDWRTPATSQSGLASHVDAVHRGFDLQRGPLFKAVLYRLAGGDRVLLAIHHLVVDGVSWRILLEDLERGYTDAVAGRAVSLDPKTVSFKGWAEEVCRYVRDGHAAAASPYWQGVTAGRDEPPARESRYGDVESVEIGLSEAETHDLLTRTHHAYTTEINDLLLTALGRTLKAWSGRGSTLILLEGHGREPLDREIDLGRTVGWFTTLYPFALTVDAIDIGEQITAVKEALRRVPRRGLDYAILRYASGQPASESLNVRPLVSFNYLGQFDGAPDSGAWFTFADEPTGAALSARIRRPAEIEVSGLVSGGRLTFSVSYAPAHHTREAMAALADRFRSDLLAVVDHCAGREESEKTISDYAFSGLTSSDFDDILKGLN